jgi:hypothetical protein
MPDEVVAAALDQSAAPAPAIDTTPAPVGGNTIESHEADAGPSIDDTLEAAWNKTQSNGVEKGADGKFVSPNGKAADAPADPNSVVQPPSDVVEPAKPAIEPPNSWTAEAKAHWAKLPPEAQAYIAQREGEAHKAITSQGDRLKSYEPIEQVVGQYRDDISRRGLSAPQALSVLFEAQRQLDTDLDGGLIHIGKTYGKNEIDLATGILARAGIDLRALLTGQQGQLPAPDPRLGQVTQELSQIKQTIQQQQQEVERQRAIEAEATLKEFAKDKPYFEEVRKLMSSFLKGEHAETLSDAYDMAVNASPKIRARIQADQRAAEEKKAAEAKAKAEEEAKRKVADATRSAKVNVRSTSAHPNPKSIDDTINETARRLYG